MPQMYCESIVFWLSCGGRWIYQLIPSWDFTLRGDKVSMLTHTSPHKHLMKIKVTICNHQDDSLFYLYLYVCCGPLVICKLRKEYHHAWHWMSLLRPGVIEQDRTQDSVIYSHLPVILKLTSVAFVNGGIILCNSAWCSWVILCAQLLFCPRYAVFYVIEDGKWFGAD